MNSWIAITAVFDDEPDDWSPLADAFERAGCPSSLQTSSPPAITGHLADVRGARDIAEALGVDLVRLGASSFKTESVPEEDWSELWKLHFNPTPIGKRLLVRPTWSSPIDEPERIEIVLDPGQAFGTGDHPTTRLCLELLESLVDSGRFDEDSRILDLGTGSGILAIAATKLGCRRVLASDIDPVAVEVARENAALNGVELELVCAPGFDEPRLDL
jgi:ribosomal protein L11 methyltransferase